MLVTVRQTSYRFYRPGLVVVSIVFLQRSRSPSSRPAGLESNARTNIDEELTGS